MQWMSESARSRRKSSGHQTPNDVHVQSGRGATQTSSASGRGSLAEQHSGWQDTSSPRLNERILRLEQTPANDNAPRAYCAWIGGPTRPAPHLRADSAESHELKRATHPNGTAPNRFQSPPHPHPRSGGERGLPSFKSHFTLCPQRTAPDWSVEPDYHAAAPSLEHCLTRVVMSDIASSLASIGTKTQSSLSISSRAASARRPKRA